MRNVRQPGNIMGTTKRGHAVASRSDGERLPPGWLAPLTAAVFAVWALYLASSAMDLVSSEEPLLWTWLPTAGLGAFTILLLGVVPHAYIALAFRKKASAVAALVSVAAIAAILASYFVARARWGALWGP
jgi:cation transport ATPase